MWAFLIGYVVGQSSCANSASDKDYGRSLLVGFGFLLSMGAAMVFPIMINDGINLSGFPIWLFNLVVSMLLMAVIGATIEFVNFDRAKGIKKFKIVGVSLAIGMSSFITIGLSHSLNALPNLVASSPADKITQGLSGIVMLLPFFILPASALFAVVYCLSRQKNNSARNLQN